MQFLTLTPNELFSSCKQMGRISLTDDGILCDWSAAGFSVNITASLAVVDFAPYRADQPVYIAVYVDGVKQIHALGGDCCRVVVPMTSGTHTLTVLRLSEGMVPLYCTGLRLATADTEGAPALLPPPANNARRVVFFGDSITCGFGNTGETTSPYLTSEQDPTEAYAWRCAALLGADAELVSISGQGIVRDCGGNTGIPIPTFFGWQSRHLRTAHVYPDDADIVVINAGTNDCGGRVTNEEFYDGAKAFLHDLRAHYPRAKLVWCYGLMGLYYDGVLRALETELAGTDAAFTYLPVSPIAWERGEVGAVGHPSVEGDVRGAAELAAALYRMV
ncbi:MAG: hypothetical protein IJW77_18140 [Clostridia bacterium]|nr:hypothetical protein [Clostridia bacterium]